MPQIMTIREAVQRAKKDGLPVSEYTLRRWIRAGLIPVRTVGHKVLLFYPNLIRYLQCEDNPPATVAAAPGISRVDMLGG